MPKLQHNFLQGKMNKDLDERLVPNGQYRDAQNIQVSTSEGSDVGAVENVLGNTKQAKKTAVVNWDAGFGLTNPKCIGVKEDPQNDKIYWFVTSDTHDAILEYDDSTGFIAPVIVDTQGVLNFNKLYLITGINILGGLLIWTDNYSEPKKINIDRFKAGSTQAGTALTTHTQVYGRAFIESDVTVAKPNPKVAIGITASSTKSLETSGNGVGINPVLVTENFNKGSAGGFFPYAPGETVAIIWTRWIESNLTFEAGEVRLTSRVAQSNGTIRDYEIVGTLANLTAPEVPGQYSAGDLTIVSITSDIPDAMLEWEMVLIEDEPVFQNEFPRFSYRWKYIDNEYSTFAPFSEAAFVASKFSYEPKDGHNIGMGNNVRKITLAFPTATYALPPADVKEIEILYKGAAAQNVYVLHTHKTSSGALTSFEITSELLGPVVESGQLLRAWDNIPRKAKAQEVIGNRIVYGNYLQNYTLDTDPAITATSTSTAFSASEQYKGQQSVKSDRTYQIGITFLDDYGRESPIFTRGEGAIKIDKANAPDKNVLKASVSTSAPSWATYFKYYVKDTASEYYNLVLDRFYDSEDGNVWLSFPSSERNKVELGGFLMLKKQHGQDTAVIADNSYKVLDIKNEAPKFIRNTNVAIAEANVEVIGNDSFVVGQREITFTGPTADTNVKFFEGFSGSASVRFERTSGGITYISQTYALSKGGPVEDNATAGRDYSLTLESGDGLSMDDNWLASLVATDVLRAIILDNINDALPEFQGKFFVKVPRNNAFTSNIVNTSKDTSISNILYSADDKLVSDWTTDDILAFGNTAVDPVTHAVKRPELDAPTNEFDLHLLEETQTAVGAWGAAQKYVDLFNNLTPGAKVQFSNTSEHKGDVYVVTTVSGPTSYNHNPPGGVSYVFKKKTVTVDRAFDDALGAGIDNLDIVETEYPSKVATPNPAIFETKPNELADLDIYYEATSALEISNLSSVATLDFSNCYAFGNGVESDRSLDDFNAPLLGKGVRVSTVLQEPYEEERKGSSMIFSGIFNSTSGFNEINQFNAAYDITSDLSPTYGTLQKLHARDTDLIALCEDKIFRVLANKDALYNADGNTNLTATNRVLGQATPYVGEFGISKNPESFASFGFRVYFTDKSRGAVIRLSRDGITPISSKGMDDFFTDEFKNNTTDIVGGFDTYTGAYNIRLNGQVLSFKEKVDGWVTRLSYSPDFSVSLNNTYYSLKNGDLWSHTNATRSNFYGVQYDSIVEPIINDNPSSIKNYKTLSYEGDGGWVASVVTDQQDGEVAEWQTKEGIHFNFIKGLATTWDNGTQSGALDTSEFSVQGLGSHTGPTTDAVLSLLLFDAVNVSLATGDTIYIDRGGIYKVGTVASISGLEVRVNNPDSVLISTGDFVFFAKDSEINTSGIIGYHMKTTMTTSSGAKKELFAVNSEVFTSSE